MITPSLAVIGAGAAGTAAAQVAAAAGIAVHLFDRFSIDLGESHPPIEAHSSTPVWGLFPSWQVAASRGDFPVLVGVDAVLLCHGSIDRNVTIAGATTPGVITASGLTNLVDRWGLLPGNRFVIIGDELHASETAARIIRAGGEFVLIESTQTARDVEIVGDQAMTGVRQNGNLVHADIVVLAAGSFPDLTLAAMAGCDMTFDDTSHAWRLVLDADGRTSVPGVWAAGSLAGAGDAVEESGRRAATAIISALTDTHPRESHMPAEPSAVRQPWRLDQRIGTESTP